VLDRFKISHVYVRGRRQPEGVICTTVYHGHHVEENGLEELFCNVVLAKRILKRQKKHVLIGEFFPAEFAVKKSFRRISKLIVLKCDRNIAVLKSSFSTLFKVI
jgi:hypothetical protein